MKTEITLDEITNKVCKALDVNLRDLKSKRRDGIIPDARSICIGLFLKQGGYLELRKIGEYFGNRDHTTVVYMRNKFDNLYKTDKIFKNRVQKVLDIV